jgi:hypothetical protein
MGTTHGKVPGSSPANIVPGLTNNDDVTKLAMKTTRAMIRWQPADKLSICAGDTTLFERKDVVVPEGHKRGFHKFTTLMLCLDEKEISLNIQWDSRGPRNKTVIHLLLDQQIMANTWTGC